MRNKPAEPDAATARVAARQHGVVSAAQLRAAGIDRFGTGRRVKAGRLHRVHRGVYAVGHPRLSFEGLCLAAVLACTEGTVLSHGSAAALWGMLPKGHVGASALGSGPGRGQIDVTVPTSSGRGDRPGIAIHRSLTLAGDSTARHMGVPVTTPTRTLRDLRRVVPPALLQRAARRALDLRLVTAAALGPDPDLTRSELERRFLRLCRRHRLPDPEVNARVGPFEVDFLWRDHAAVVETDGFRYHAGRAAFESDRARDARLQARGYRVLRFTYRQVRESPQAVVASLRSVIGQSG